jgi:hypothetical protein
MFQRKPAILTLVLTLVFSAIPTLPNADDTDAWKQWQVLLQRSCPNNHVDWTCDMCWTQLTGAFEDTLGASDQRKISRVRDFRGCENEKIGLSCEMGASLKAYLQVGLLQRLAAFGCRAVKCEEPALCTRFPDHAP